MKFKNLQNYVVYGIAIILLISIATFNMEGMIDKQENEAYAKVVKEYESKFEEFSNLEIKKYDIEIISGDFKGKKMMVEETIVNETVFYANTKVGMEVLIMYELDEMNGDISVAYITGSRKDKYIKPLVLIFILLTMIVGGIKGIKSLISLVITIVIVLKVLLPQLLSGANPIVWSIGVAIFVTIITMFIISGINKKSVSAILGTACGSIIAGIIAYSFGEFMSLTGAASEEAKYLAYIPDAIEFDLGGLLLAGIILGSLGAVMDVAMSISSSIIEIEKANPMLRMREVFNSGMNVGKDIMGTMTNTLILAYTGTSMHLMLLLMAYDIPMVSILNNELIITEILRALAGTVGLIFTIPITAILAASIGKIGQEKENIF